MITLCVSNLHVLLPVISLLQHRQEIALEFVVDTGFTDYLSLPLKTRLRAIHDI